mgnify:FL=1|jgi:hypothetical protein
MTSDETGSSAQRRQEEDRVAAYLREHPSFFDRHPEVLESLNLSHDSGKAVSLVERQITVLRERNMEMRQRLNNLLESARSNDLLFEKTKRLVLNVLEAGNLQGVIDALYTSLGTDYQVEFYSLLLFTPGTEASLAPARVVGLDEAQNQVGTLLRTNRAICGVLRDEELAFLFGDQAEKVGSVAAVTLNHGSTFGILAIGNADPHYYRSSMGTLFLTYIAEVLNRVIPRLL